MNARDYLLLLRENYWIVIGSVLVCAVLGLGVSLVTPPSYTASTSFFVTVNGDDYGSGATSEVYQGTQLAKERVTTYTELLGGARVAEDAARALGDDPGAVASAITVTSAQDTVLIGVELTGDSPASAVARAQAVSTAFTTLVDELEARRNGPPTPIVTVQQVVAPTEPQFPTTPRSSLNIAIGVLIGLIVGLGVAIARRSTDTTVRSGEELAEATGAPLLGTVPEVPASDAVTLPERGRPGSGPRVEEFRRIRATVEHYDPRRRRRVIVVTSARRGDGVSTVAAHLAAALAAVGRRVLLIQADMRAPSVGGLAGIDDTVGLSTVLCGRLPLKAVVQTSPPYRFDVLTAGPSPAAPNELLASRRAADLFREVRARYDYVIVDAPPLLPVADAIELGLHADGALVVGRWSRSRADDLRTAVAGLAGVGVPLLGTVLFRTAAERRDPNYPTVGAPAAAGGHQPVPAPPVPVVPPARGADDPQRAFVLAGAPATVRIPDRPGPDGFSPPLPTPQPRSSAGAPPRPAGQVNGSGPAPANGSGPGAAPANDGDEPWPVVDPPAVARTVALPTVGSNDVGSDAVPDPGSSDTARVEPAPAGEAGADPAGAPAAQPDAATKPGPGGDDPAERGQDRR